MLTHMHKGQKGQTALETAIILIAFIVVASVFAFTILSAGSASTEKGEEAIYAGLEGVQSSMSVKGAVIANGAADEVTSVDVSLALVAGGEPVDINITDPVIVVMYRDADENTPIAVDDWTRTELVGDGDDLLEEGELVQFSFSMDNVTSPPGPNTEFTIEIVPPSGAVLQVNRTTPAAIEAVMELR